MNILHIDTVNIHIYTYTCNGSDNSKTAVARYVFFEQVLETSFQDLIGEVDLVTFHLQNRQGNMSQCNPFIKTEWL